jgi:predicted phage terminase large subunit-like protein
MLTMKGKHSGCIATLVEDKANGPAIIDTLGKAIPGLLAVNPEGGKIARAFAVQPTIEAGNVYLPDPSIAPWVHDFIEECASFPKGGTDDEVDAATQAINYLNNHFAGTEIYSGGVNPSTDKLKGY